MTVLLQLLEAAETGGSVCPCVPARLLEVGMVLQYPPLRLLGILSSKTQFSRKNRVWSARLQ